METSSTRKMKRPLDLAKLRQKQTQRQHPYSRTSKGKGGEKTGVRNNSIVQRRDDTDDTIGHTSKLKNETNIISKSITTATTPSSKSIKKDDYTFQIFGTKPDNNNDNNNDHGHETSKPRVNHSSQNPFNILNNKTESMKRNPFAILDHLSNLSTDSSHHVSNDTIIENFNKSKYNNNDNDDDSSKQHQHENHRVLTNGKDQRNHELKEEAENDVMLDLNNDQSSQLDITESQIQIKKLLKESFSNPSSDFPYHFKKNNYKSDSDSEYSEGEDEFEDKFDSTEIPYEDNNLNFVIDKEIEHDSIPPTFSTSSLFQGTSKISRLIAKNQANNISDTSLSFPQAFSKLPTELTQHVFDSIVPEEPSFCIEDLNQEWTLKTSLICNFSTVIDSLKPVGSMTETMSLTSFVLDNFQKETEPSTLLKSLLCRWQYPARSPPPSHTALMAKIFAAVGVDTKFKNTLKDYEKLELSSWQAQEEDWKQTFRSLYYSLRNGKTPYFYYLNSEFAALFLGEKLSSPIPVKVIISKSSVGLRRALQKEEIEFEMPFNDDGNDHKNVKNEKVMDIENETNKSDHNDNDDDDDDPEQSRQFPTRPKKSSNPYSTLIISDHHAVHGLFDFLLNWIDPIASRRAEGFPLLISPKPFLNASLKAAQIHLSSVIHAPPIHHPIPTISSSNFPTSSTSSSSSTSFSNSNSTSSNSSSRLLIKGIILPSFLLNLIQLFEKVSNGNFQVQFKLKDITQGLNDGMKQRNQDNNYNNNSSSSGTSSSSSNIDYRKDEVGVYHGIQCQNHRYTKLK